MDCRGGFGGFEGSDKGFVNLLVGILCINMYLVLVLAEINCSQFLRIILRRRIGKKVVSEQPAC